MSAIENSGEVFLKRPKNILLVIFLLYFSFISVFGEEDKGDKTEKELNYFMINIETGPLDPVQIKGIKKIAKSKDEKISAKATALLAKYICECENKPDKALAKIAPFVLSPEKSAEFAKEDKPGTEKPFPPVSDWQLKNPVCCVVVAGILSYQKKYPEALAGLNFVGEKLDGIPRALAAEGVGDILYDMKQFQGSADAFKLGLKVLDFFKKSSEYLYYPDKVVDIIYQRIQGKLSKAERALDCERYGPEFVAYKEARKFEFSGDFLRATVFYERIIKDFPDTVYSEAAKLYRPKCLFRLSDKSESKKAGNEILELEARIQKDRTMLRKDSDKMSRRIAEALDKFVREDENLLPEIKNIPIGEKAAGEAMADLEFFISENELGLYRGEALLLLADYHLEREFEPGKALAAYDRAVKWLDEAKKAKAEIDKFQVPLKTMKVALPPRTMHSYDVFGNMKWSKMDAGNVMNQFTCPWYFDWLELSVLSKRGLCNFILGNKEQALEDIKVIVRNSPEERKCFQEGRYNSYSRLSSEFKLDRMYATKEELDQFKGKARIAVMVADYYYEIEDWDTAFERYTLYRDIFGKKFNKNANAYFDYILGFLYMLKKDDDKGFALLGKFEGKFYEDTPTWPRALCALFSRYQSIEGKQEYALGLLCRIHEKMPDDITGQKAYYDQAEYLYALGRYDEAIPIFEDVIKKYPRTWLANGAGEYLDKIKKIEKNK